MKIHNLKINNPILEVFTKEYRENALYNQSLKINISKFRLNNDNYDVEEVVKLLKKRGFINNYKGIKNES